METVTDAENYGGKQLEAVTNAAHVMAGKMQLEAVTDAASYGRRQLVTNAIHYGGKKLKLLSGNNIQCIFSLLI